MKSPTFVDLEIGDGYTLNVARRISWGKAWYSFDMSTWHKGRKRLILAYLAHCQDCGVNP